MAATTAKSASVVGRQACNGFYMTPEPEAIRVNEENIAPFSMPQEVLSYVPPPDLAVYKFKNGDTERKIHCNTELTKQELEQLAQMQKEAIRLNREFYPSVSVMATRYISRARGDVKKALQLMCDTQEWRSKYFRDGPIVDSSLLDDLKLGIVYFVGRDKELRPTIVCRADRVPAEWYKTKQTDRLIRILIFCMEYMVRYMLHPGRVEGNNLIVDLKGLSATQVPLKELSKLYSIMSHHYMGRVFKFYVINLSTWLSAIASAAKALLTDRQRQKLNVLSSPSQLAEDFALHQLEVDHGGSREMITDFFPFPLQCGPFEARYAKGPELERVKRVDKVLTATNCRGRMWDTKKSPEDNVKMEYPLEAMEIFEKCGLQVPKHLAEKAERHAEKERMKKEQSAAQLSDKEASVEPKNSLTSVSGAPVMAGTADTPTSCLPTSPGAPAAVGMNESAEPLAATKEEDEEEEVEEIIMENREIELPDLQSTEVAPVGGWFSCRCCAVAAR